MIPLCAFIIGATATGGYTAARGYSLALRAAAPHGVLLRLGSGLAALLAGAASWLLFAAAIAAWDPMGFIGRQLVGGVLLGAGGAGLYRAACRRQAGRLGGVGRVAGGGALLLGGICIAMASAPFGFAWLWLARGGQGLP